MNRIISKKIFVPTLVVWLLMGILNFSPNAEAVHTLSGNLVGHWKLDETTGTDGSNLVSNPGFETYPISPGFPPSWGYNGGDPTGAQWTRETANPFSGSNALRGTGTVTTQESTFQPVTTTAGLSYIFEAAINSIGPLASSAFVLEPGTGNTICQFGSAVGAGYVVGRCSFTSIGGQYRIILFTQQNSVALFDQIKLQQIQAKDSSGNNNHGTLIGSPGPTINQSGARPNTNTAYLFDGVDDYISVADSASLDITVGSWGGWVNAEVDDTLSPLTNIVMQKGSSYNLVTTPGAAACSTTTNSVGAAIPFNVYVHIVCVADGATLRIYVFGSPTTSVASGLTPNSDPLLLGSDGGLGLFPGLEDDIRIYNVALSQQAIIDWANEPSHGGSAVDVSITGAVLDASDFTVRADSVCSIDQVGIVVEVGASLTVADLDVVIKDTTTGTVILSRDDSTMIHEPTGSGSQGIYYFTVTLPPGHYVAKGVLDFTAIGVASVFAAESFDVFMGSCAAVITDISAILNEFNQTNSLVKFEFNQTNSYVNNTDNGDEIVDLGETMGIIAWILLVALVYWTSTGTGQGKGIAFVLSVMVIFFGLIVLPATPVFIIIAIAAGAILAVSVFLPDNKGKLAEQKK